MGGMIIPPQSIYNMAGYREALDSGCIIITEEWERTPVQKIAIETMFRKWFNLLFRRSE